MAARKSPTFRKAAAVPREIDEKLKRTTVWLAESDEAWLRARFGKNVAFGIRNLIAAAKGGRPRSQSATSKTVLTVVCVACDRAFAVDADVPRVLNAPAYCMRADCR